MNTRPRFQATRVFCALMIREMITRYGRSWGGYVWAVLEPMATIMVLAIAVSQIVRVPPIGTSFILFYATGYLPVHFFSDTAANCGTAVALNRELMHLPMVRPHDAVFARFALTFLTLILVSVLILGTLVLLTDESIHILPGLLLEAMIGAALLGLGIGTINAVLFAFFPVWRQIWGVIRGPLMLISGVLFLFDEMPAKVQAILWWNPLIHAVGQARAAVYPSYHADYASMLYLYGLAIAAIVIGGALLNRHRGAVVELR